MLVIFEGFFYEKIENVWYFIGDNDSLIETNFKIEVKNIRTLERLNKKFA